MEAMGPRSAARAFGVALIDSGELMPEEFDNPLEVIVTDSEGKATTCRIGPAHVEVDVEVEEVTP